MELMYLFKRLYDSGATGSQIDQGLLVMLGNFLNDDQLVFEIPLEKVDLLVRMIPESQKTFLLLKKSKFMFCVYYGHSELFPLGRMYFIIEENMFECDTINRKLEPYGCKFQIIDNEFFNDIVGKGSCKARIEKYKDRIKNETAVFSGIVNGRIDSTVVSQGFYFKTDGCLICGDKPIKLVQSTCADDQNGIIQGFHLCNLHYEEAILADGLLNYLYQKLNVPIRIQTVKLTQEEIIELAISILIQELDCEITKVTIDTITAYRMKSKFKVIVRICDPLNYGYMIFNDLDKEVARFDSANHHQISYGPDHLHSDVLKRKKDVVNSFTYGSPVVDHIIMKKIIEQHERKN